MFIASHWPRSLLVILSALRLLSSECWNWKNDKNGIYKWNRWVTQEVNMVWFMYILHIRRQLAKAAILLNCWPTNNSWPWFRIRVEVLDFDSTAIPRSSSYPPETRPWIFPRIIISMDHGITLKPDAELLGHQLQSRKIFIGHLKGLWAQYPVRYERKMWGPQKWAGHIFEIIKIHRAAVQN